MPDTDRRFVMRVPAQPYMRVDRNDYSLDPRLVGRRVEVRVSQTEITVVALDTGELACRHARVFAGGLAFTDPATRPRWTGCAASAERAATSTSSCARSHAMTS